MKFTLGHNIPTYNLLMVIAVVLGISLVGYDMLVSTPSKEVERQKHRGRVNQLKEDILLAEKGLEKAAPAVTAAVYSGTLEQVSPSIMSQVTNLASSKGLKVLSFRPQRAEEIEGLISQPFIMSLEGDFTACAELVRALERQSDRLAVSQIQIASADSESSRVSMTVEITAFIMTPNKTQASAKETANGKA